MWCVMFVRRWLHLLLNVRGDDYCGDDYFSLKKRREFEKREKGEQWRLEDAHAKAEKENRDFGYDESRSAGWVDSSKDDGRWVWLNGDHSL